MPIQHTFAVSRAIAVALAVASSSTAFAQAGADVALEEIVITAQKREETVQNAMLSVRAIAPDDIQRAGVKDFTQLNKIAPEINVNAQQIGTVVAIRGVRSNAFSPSDESANAIHIDGSYLAGFQGLRGMMFDIQRLEVLSGPQGTLYGRNATGGSINVITNKPGNEFGGTASLEVGNYNLLSADAALNLPISDTLGVRVAGRHYKHDGYYKDSGLDDADQNSGRVSVRWNMSDKQTLWFSADIQHEGGKGVGSNITATGPAAYASTTANGNTVNPTSNTWVLAPGATAPALSSASSRGQYVTSPLVVVSSDPRRNAVSVGNADQARTNTQLEGFTGEYTHDLSFASWNVLGSYRELHQFQRNGTSQPDLQPAYNVNAGWSQQKANWKSFETRLTSASTEPLKWVGGLYWFNEDLARADNATYLVNVTPNAVPPNPFTGLPAGGQGGTTSTTAAIPAGTVNTDGINNFTRVTAYAVFGEMTWSPISTLHLTGGARYNVDKKSAAGEAFNYASPNTALVPLVVPVAGQPGPPFTLTSPGSAISGAGQNFNSRYNLSDEWSQATWKVNIAYDLTETNSVYANVSKGYKSGGFSFGPRPKYDPEQVISYEIGSKNEFFNRRLRLNAAAWFLDYDNYETVTQQCNLGLSQAVCDQNIPTNNSLGAINAGSARNIGASFTLDARLFTADHVNLSFQYVDAKYKDFDLSKISYIAPNSRLDYTDTQVGYTAKYTANGSYTKVWQVGEGTLDAQLAAQYASKRLLNNQAVPGTAGNLFSEDATTLDFSIRYAPSTTWEVTAWVNNLTDELIKTAAAAPQGAGAYNGPPVYTGGAPSPLPNTTLFTANYAAPRTFGVTLEVKF